MHKKIISFLMALVLLLMTMPVSSFAGDRTYTAGQFSDVNEDAWYGFNGAKTVAGIWESSLMDGIGGGRFGVGSSLTVAQALVVADKIHYEYETGAALVCAETSDSPWYQFYANYAIEHGIIEAGEFTDYSAEITRAQMVHVFAHCLPESEFQAIGIVEALPDVKEGDQYADEIFMLYQAGILSGSDSLGTFHPDNPIKREEAAAIFLHVYNADTRKFSRHLFAPAGNINWSNFDQDVIDQCSKILVEILEPNMSDREKVVAIHDYMVNAYHYDYDIAEGRSSKYGLESYDYTCLLKYGVGVCEAYMELFSLLCDECGVRCEMVIGKDHGWNRVWIDDGWLYVDVTFDDPIYYFDGVLTDHYCDDYLLKTEEEMGVDHTIEETGVWLTAIGR